MAVLVRTCPHCHAQKVAFTLRWEWPRGQNFFVVGLCGACGHPILADVARTSSSEAPLKVPYDVEQYYFVIRTWPNIQEIEAPRYTPPQVSRRFIEGENAFSRGDWNASVAMYRSALDISTKGLDGVPPKLSFYERLKWLHSENRITSEMRDWADHVRIEGNEALHDPEYFEEKDASPLRLFTETFLKYIYEMPGEVAAFRSRTGSNLD